MQVQTPGFISTKMSNYMEESAAVPSAKTFVKAGVKHIGYETDAVPFPMHAMTRYALFPIHTP